MDQEPFLTLAAGGMQPGFPSLTSSTSSGSESNVQLPSSPASSVSATTHDVSRTKYHIKDLSIFAKRLEDAASSVFPNLGRSRYQRVRVLLLRWEEDEMGVQYELDDLAKTFRDLYGFETETWLIPTADAHLSLMGKAFTTVQEFGKPDDLLIVYYAGHGFMNGSRQPLWSCTSNPSYASLQWFAIQTIFEQAKSDVLLLLDCCAAASSAPADGHCSSVTETIAACGFETWAPQPGRHSFTNTLIAVLEEWQDRPGFTAAMLHCEVLNRLRHEKPERRGKTKNFECRRTPVHISSTSDPRAGSVQLCSRRFVGLNQECTRSTESASMSLDNPTLNELESSDGALGDGTDSYGTASLTAVHDTGETALPHVLISLALEEEQLLDVEQCRRWLQQFPALATYAKVEGVYRSNSTLLILSMPVVIWDWMPNDRACAFIGYVHSKNMFAPDLDQEPCTVPSKRVRMDYETRPLQPQNSRQSSPAPKPEPEISVVPPLRRQEPIEYWSPSKQLGSFHYDQRGHMVRSSSEEQSQLLVGAGGPRVDKSPYRGTAVGSSMREAGNGSMKKGFSNGSTISQGSTLGSNMSRASTVFDEPFLETIQMMKLNSDSSMFGLPRDCADYNSAWTYTPFLGEKMEKSNSNDSFTSLSSTGSRSRRRLQAQVQAVRPLEPKGGSDEQGSSRNKLNEFGQRAKVGISKPTYVRPKHDRIFCKQCDSTPEGFRGEHELRRHQDREHPVSIKKWICVQPEVGQPNIKPVLPLSRCKACAVQKKQYGAYYNAAAHLRRAHFNPKSKPKRDQSKSQPNFSDTRGGKAGGDWPSMSDLKLWMKEIEVPASTYPNAQFSTVDEDEDFEDLDSSFLDTSTNFDPDPLFQDVQMMEFTSQIPSYSNDMAQFGDSMDLTPNTHALRPSSSGMHNLIYTGWPDATAIEVSEVAVSTWNDQDQPLSSYNFVHQPLQLQKSTLKRAPNPEQMPEADDFGEDPASYILRTKSSIL